MGTETEEEIEAEATMDTEMQVFNQVMDDALTPAPATPVKTETKATAAPVPASSAPPAGSKITSPPKPLVPSPETKSVAPAT